MAPISKKPVGGAKKQPTLMAFLKRGPQNKAAESPKKQVKTEEEKKNEILDEKKEENVEEKKEEKKVVKEEKAGEQYKKKRRIVEESDSDDDAPFENEENKEEEKKEEEKVDGKKKEEEKVVEKKKEKQPEKSKFEVTPKKKSLKKMPAKKETVKKEKVKVEEKKEEKKEVKEEAEKPAKPASWFGVKKKKRNYPDVSSYSKPAYKFDPIKDAPWKKGDKVPFVEFCRALDDVEATTKRLIKLNIFSNFLRSVIALSPEQLAVSLLMASNKLGAEYENLEMGFSHQTVLQTIAEHSNRKLGDVRDEYKECGDLGQVAFMSHQSQQLLGQLPDLTVVGVFNKFKSFATDKGNNVMSRRKGQVKAMFTAAHHTESIFIARSLGGSLRIGLAQSTVISSLAQAVVLTPPTNKEKHGPFQSATQVEALKPNIESAVEDVKMAFSEHPNLNDVAAALLEAPHSELSKKCSLIPGVPVQPMLAHPTKGYGEVMKRLKGDTITCEYKYDGERAQVHLLPDGRLQVYSRSLETNTQKYPDIIEALKPAITETTKSFVMDAEVVAYDQEKDKILPFQVLINRGRKDVDVNSITHKICLFPFDLIYYNGESLLRADFCDRREYLRKAVKEIKGQVQFATFMNFPEFEEGDLVKMESFMDEALKAGTEGLMCKTLKNGNATYEPSKRSYKWLKVKKDYLDSGGDTLDLVPIGAEMGNGDRAGRYGTFLMACYDEESGNYQAVAKTGGGFKDDELKKYYDLMKPYEVKKVPAEYEVSADNKKDISIWFNIDHNLVFEIQCADLTLSEKYRAAVGLASETKGISLRFPRFLRHRDDKKPTGATNSDQILEMYNGQALIDN